MKKGCFSKISSFLLVLCLCINASCIHKNDDIKSVHIFSINDFHGATVGYGEDDFIVQQNVPGIIRLSNALNEEIKKSPNSIIVSAGDNNSGEVFASSQHGESIFPILKKLNVQYSAIGNHEFDWEKTLNSDEKDSYLSKKIYDSLGRTEKTKGNYYISSNILKNRNNDGSDKDFYNKEWSYENNDDDYNTWKDNIVEWVDPYKIIDLDDLKICLIGLTTVLTMTDSNKNATKDYAFIDYNASVAYAQRLCHEENVDIFDQIDSFVLLTHVASDMSNQQVIGEAAELAANLTTKVDAIITGHSHKVVSGTIKNKKYGNDIWIGQAGSNGKNYLDVKFNFSSKANPGNRLINVEMSTYLIPINGGSTKNKSLAKQEIETILENAKQKEKNSLLSNTIDEYLVQKDKVIDNLDNPLFTSIDDENKFNLVYQAISKSDIGHEYFCPKQIVDKAGQWITKGIIGGCNSFYSHDDDTNTNQASLSFINQDSIKAQLLESNMINKLQLYQFLPYDNYLYQGWISVSQLWSILNYSLSGGWPNENESDDDSIFKYGLNNPQYKWIDEMETNHFTNEKEISLPEIATSATTKTKLNYLCGPLQFYGCKVEIKETSSEKQLDNNKHLKKYDVNYEEINNNGEIINLPKIWIYDPLDKNNNLDDPSTWKKVTINGSRYDNNNEWNYQDDLIPVVINNFAYDGGNYQNTMFKEFFAFNAQKDEKYKVFRYPENDFFERDVLAMYAKYWNDKQTSESFNFELFACNNDEKNVVVFNKN